MRQRAMREGWGFQQGEKIEKSSPCRKGMGQRKVMWKGMGFQQGGKSGKSSPCWTGSQGWPAGTTGFAGVLDAKRPRKLRKLRNSIGRGAAGGNYCCCGACRSGAAEGSNYRRKELRRRNLSAPTAKSGIIRWFRQTQPPQCIEMTEIPGKPAPRCT